MKPTLLLSVFSFAGPNVIKRVSVGVFVMGAVWLGASYQQVSAQDVDEKTPAPDAASAGDELRLEEVKLQVRRARIGLLSTTSLFVVGTALYVGSAARTWSGTGPDPLSVAGASLFVSGAIGMLATGIVLGVRNRRMNQLQPRDERINRARIALLSTTGVFLASGIFWVAYASSCVLIINDSRCAALGGTATAMLLAGAAGMIATGVLLGVRRRKFKASEQATVPMRPRIGWDLAHARVVF